MNHLTYLFEQNYVLLFALAGQHIGNQGYQPLEKHLPAIPVHAGQGTVNQHSMHRKEPGLLT
jgi:hypothetical protein